LQHVDVKITDANAAQKGEKAGEIHKLQGKNRAR